MTYQRRPVSTSSVVGAEGGMTSGWASTTGGATSTGSASATAPARRSTLLTSSTETSSSGTAVPRNARAASAAAWSDSLAASTSSAPVSGSGGAVSGSGCSSLRISSSRSSLTALPLRRRRRRRRDGLVEQEAVHEIREELIGAKDVRGDDRRDEDDQHGEADDRLPVGPRDLLQLRPALLCEAHQADVSGADGGRLRTSSHQRTSARRERLELSTAGFGDQCSTS